MVSVLLALLLGAPLAWLRRRHIPESVGAGILVFGSVAIFAGGLSLLADPAAQWIGEAPAHLAKVEARVTALMRPFHSIQQTAAKVDSATSGAGGGTSRQMVQVAEPGMLKRVSGSSAHIIGQLLAVLFLSYFLLAAAPLLKQKLVTVIPARNDRVEVQEVVREIASHMSRYLWLSSAMNLGVGLLTWGLLSILHYPNAALWGVMAGVLNYVPYVGAMATLAAIGLAGAVSFPTLTPVLAGVGGYLLIHVVQSNLVTPALLGRKLPLNPAALFLGLLFFGWLWGVTGAVLAVPLTVMIQVVCARIPAMEKVAVLLDS